MNSLKVKKMIKEEVCPECEGASEELVGDEWEGGRHEKCDYCGGAGMIKTYKGMRVIDTMEEGKEG